MKENLHRAGSGEFGLESACVFTTSSHSHGRYHHDRNHNSLAEKGLSLSSWNVLHLKYFISINVVQVSVIVI